ncbi:MAG: hypothetical protein ACTTH0_03695 [Eubacteriales bacterium]
MLKINNFSKVYESNTNLSKEVKAEIEEYENLANEVLAMIS